MAEPYTHDTAITGPNDLSLSEHLPHDNLMPNASPARKMYSANPVSNEQYTEDNRGTSMAGIRAMARAAKVGPGLRKAFKKEQ